MWRKWIPRHGWKWWFSNKYTQFNFSQQNCMYTQYQFQQQITQFNRMNVSTFEHIAWCRRQHKMMTVKCFLCGVRMQFSTWISLDNIFTLLRQWCLQIADRKLARFDAIFMLTILWCFRVQFTLNWCNWLHRRTYDWSKLLYHVEASKPFITPMWPFFDVSITFHYLFMPSCLQNRLFVDVYFRVIHSKSCFFACSLEGKNSCEIMMSSR